MISTFVLILTSASRHSDAMVITIRVAQRPEFKTLTNFLYCPWKMQALI